LLKTGQIPSKANPEKQREFLRNDLKPKLNEAKKGKRKVYFVDAAHFVMGSYLIQLWCIIRVFIKTSSGRQRYNVLGAIDIFHKELITITNEAYINSDVVCKLIQKIYGKHGSGNIPITLVMDNARYQRCKKVTNYADELGIEILFLPTYSPNLNLIERLWKFVKKKVLYAKYYEKFSDFKTAIDSCLNGIDKEYNSEISSLLTPNFQTFDTKKSEDKNTKIA
jgi:transposase